MNPVDSYRVGRRIRVPEVRVIGGDGAQLGVLTIQQAMRAAEEAGLDLVEVSPKAVPPVCRIMDYGKFKYENAKKTKQAKKHQTFVQIKEMKFRPKTDQHDLDFKTRAIRRFVEEGNKVKLVIVFRGREIVHPETGRGMLQRVVQRVADIAAVEQIAMMEGRRMSMIIGPKAQRGAATGPGAAPGAPGATGPLTSRPLAAAGSIAPTTQPTGAAGATRPPTQSAGAPGATRPPTQATGAPGATRPPTQSTGASGVTRPPATATAPSQAPSTQPKAPSAQGSAAATSAPAKPSGPGAKP